GYGIFREYSIDPLERFMVKDVLLTSMAENLDLPTQNIPSIYADETCRCAADRMAANDVTQLKVLNRKDKKVLGIVSLQALLKARLMSFKEETYRETMFPFKRKVPGKN